MGLFVKQSKWSGGQADSEVLGLKDSFYEGVGLDIHSSPGLLKVSQALAKESGSTVTDFPKFVVNASDGNTYWFGDTGKIYKRTSSGVWSNVYTDSNGAILGAEEYNGYIYWATATKLGRQATTNASSEASWTSQNNTWATLTSASFHPMVVQGIYLCIGNNRSIATVDDVATFTAAGTSATTLALISPIHSIKCIAKFGIDVIVGTVVNANYSSARIYRWDTVSPAYLSDDDIPEIGVNAFVPYENYIFAQAGNSGSVYYYDGSQPTIFKRIRGNYANQTMIVHPGSSAVFRGFPMFGVSNLSNNPCNEGVYTLGRYDKNYPVALNLEFVISQNKISAIEIGALLAYGSTLMVAWKDGSTYGVDKIDWINKYASAYIISQAIGSTRGKRKVYKRFAASYYSLPASTSITFSTRKNYGSDVTLALTDTNSTDFQTLAANTSIASGILQYKIAFTVSSNNAPILDEVYVEFEETGTI